MVGVDQLEGEIALLAERHGLAVYDVEVISFGRATLRVFLERGGEEKGVTVQELESFARVLIPFINLKELFPREGQVEVSSPGLFRKLRRPAHFSAAVGQPISVTAAGESGKQTLKARLLAVSSDGITLESETLPYIPFANILRAQLQPEIRI